MSISSWILFLLIFRKEDAIPNVNFDYRGSDQVDLQKIKKKYEISYIIFNIKFYPMCVKKAADFFIAGKHRCVQEKCNKANDDYVY